MRKRVLKEKAADLFKNDLTAEERQEIINDLATEGITPGDIESLGKLSSDLENAFGGEPSERMDMMFYSMLENESRQPKPGKQEHNYIILKNRHAWMLVAAGIALFILGWFSASQLGSSSLLRKDQVLAKEVRDLRETLVLTMLSQSSAAERIKAVNMIKEFPSAGSRIIDDLFKALNSDENDNVRLLALDALLKYTDQEEVRRQLVSSIPAQTSPMIQMRMAEIMTALNEKSAVPEFHRLLEDASLNYSVRTTIQEAVGILL